MTDLERKIKEGSITNRHYVEAMIGPENLGLIIATTPFQTGTFAPAELHPIGEAVLASKPTESEDEKQRQIEAIKQNLGNAEAFIFPEDMTVEELFEDIISMRSSPANRLIRRGVRSVAELLNQPADYLSGLKEIGPKTMKSILEKLQEKGILPKSLAGESVPAEITPAEAQPAASRTMERAHGSTNKKTETKKEEPFTLPDDQVVDLSIFERKVADRIKRGYRKGVLADEIIRVVWPGKDVEQGKKSLTVVISSLRKKFAEKGWIIPPNKGKKNESATYKFEKIRHPRVRRSRVEAVDTRSAREKREELIQHPVPESRLLALSAFLGDSKIDIEQIRQVLGPGRNNSTLTFWNCARALINAAIFLKGRISKGLAEDQEKETWEYFRAIMDENPKDEIKRFHDLIRGWYHQQMEAKSHPPAEAAETQDEHEGLEHAALASDAGEGVRLDNETADLLLIGIIELNPTRPISPEVLARQALIIERVKGIIRLLGSRDNYGEAVDAGVLRAKWQDATGERLSDIDMQKVVDGRYVKRIQGEHHTGSFSLRDCITLLYVNKFGNNFSPKQRRELFKIINAEYRAWDS